jgi:hypothetical protein
VRRNYVWVSRRWYDFERALGRLYLSLTSSPTWNFVAVLGTLGIMLTLLLFLSPLEPHAETAQGPPRATADHREWGLDSRLAAAHKTAPRDLPVEVVLRGERRAARAIPELAEETSSPPRYRRRRPSIEDRPLEPVLAPEPMPVAEAPQEADWLDAPPRRARVGRGLPPRLGLEVSLVRRPAEPMEQDVSLSARTEFPILRALRDRRWKEDAGDGWQAHVARTDVAPPERPLTVAALSGEDTGTSAWEPPAIPETAPAAVEVGLEVRFDRGRGPRRLLRSPQLRLSNVGSTIVPRIDVVCGRLPETDFTIPQSLSHHAVSELPPGGEEFVPLRHRSGSSNVVSVLVTAFVGADRLVVEPPPETSVAPRRRDREPDSSARPYLTLTTGRAEPLRQFHMVSIPIRVINDGSMALEDVVIVAEIPSTLAHRHGPTVHYRIGALRPNEARETRLLVTPREAGTALISLSVSDGAESARDDETATVEVVPELIPDTEPLAARRADDARWTSTHRRGTPSF